MWRRTTILLILGITCFKNAELTGQLANEDYEKEYGKVIQVSAIFRHGNRSPYTTYPKDPHPTTLWPDGLGQLLKKGKQCLYKLGKWYKQRYSALVKTISSHSNVTVTSSDKDRTIMSAQCFLAGFHSLDKLEYSDTFLPWEPVPIHTIAKTQDNIIWMSKDCPTAIYHEKKFYRRRRWRRIYDKYQKTFDYLQKKSGYNFSKNDISNSVNKLDDLHDILFVQNENNMTLPSWTGKVFPRQLLHLLDTFLYKHVECSLKIRRLFIGPLLKLIVSNMLEKAENNSKKIFHFYSGHDITIKFITYALRFRTDIYPPYGSTLIFELRRKRTEHFVTIFYANTTTTSPYFVPVPKCGSPCTLTNFVQATDYLIPNDWDLECQPSKKTFKSHTIL